MVSSLKMKTNKIYQVYIAGKHFITQKNYLISFTNTNNRIILLRKNLTNARN